MKHEDWLARWREGRTGWHQSEVTPLLQQHWPALAVAPETQVLVPLCGKSLDLLWLAKQGLQVLGIELSELAVQHFFAEHQLAPTRQSLPQGMRYSAGRISIIVADIFALDPRVFASCGAIYDRAALIALAPDDRRRYAQQVYAALPAGAAGLLIALEYDPTYMIGPPFSVPPSEVHALLATDWQVTLAQRRPSSGPDKAQAGAVFDAAVYQLARR